MKDTENQYELNKIPQKNIDECCLKQPLLEKLKEKELDSSSYFDSKYNK